MKVLQKDAFLRKELAKAGLITIEKCTQEENSQYLELVKAKEPLPIGIYSGETPDVFIKTIPSEVSDAEEMILLETLKTKNIISINGWVTIIGVLTILGLIGGLITIIAVFA
jgi:hypothetical protein